MKERLLKDIEEIIRNNLDSRGLESIRSEGDFSEAVRELYISETVFIVTGFVIRDSMTGETDGPLGSLSLGNTLASLGKNVIIITDKYSKKIIRDSMVLMNLNIPLEVIPFKNSSEFSKELIDTYKPTHIIGIERPGKAKDGNYYSMRGEPLGDLIPDTDVLFNIASRRGIKTIAIGDGGNEVGMGKVKDSIRRYVPLGEKISATYSADLLVIAGVSNWGAHGLSAGLSILSNKHLLYDVDMEKMLLKTMIDSGAVDGCTKRNEMSVDGLDLSYNLNILDEIRKVMKAHRINYS